MSKKPTALFSPPLLASSQFILAEPEQNKNTHYISPTPRARAHIHFPQISYISSAIHSRSLLNLLDLVDVLRVQLEDGSAKVLLDVVHHVKALLTLDEVDGQPALPESRKK